MFPLTICSLCHVQSVFAHAHVPMMVDGLSGYFDDAAQDTACEDVVESMVLSVVKQKGFLLDVSENSKRAFSFEASGQQNDSCESSQTSFSDEINNTRHPSSLLSKPRVMDCDVKQPYLPKTQRYYGVQGSIEGEESKLHKLFSFQSPETIGRKVSGMCWLNSTSLLVAGYAESPTSYDGRVVVWSPCSTSPEWICKTPAPVSSLSVSSLHKFVAVRLSDGSVAVYNVKQDVSSKQALIFHSSQTADRHMGRVWQILWVGKSLSASDDNFVSISADGCIKQWSILMSRNGEGSCVIHTLKTESGKKE